MEGYIEIRKRSYYDYDFTKYYVIIDDQNLIVYEKLDVKSFEPRNLQSIYSLKDVNIVRINKEVKYGLELSNLSYTILLKCESPLNEKMWYIAIENAMKFHNLKEIEDKKITNNMSLLNLPNIKISDLAHEMIRKEYKKLSLKLHPDRGGNIEEFRMINVAYEELKEFCKEKYDEENNKKIIYEAVLEKVNNNIGFGLSISENIHRKRCLVDSIDENSIIISITLESGGNIEINDALIAINGEDCSLWSKNRIRGRLSNVRIPLGSAVKFTFERRIPNANKLTTDNNNNNNNNEINNNDNNNSSNSNHDNYKNYYDNDYCSDMDNDNNNDDNFDTVSVYSAGSLSCSNIFNEINTVQNNEETNHKHSNDNNDTLIERIDMNYAQLDRNSHNVDGNTLNTPLLSRKVLRETQLSAVKRRLQVDKQNILQISKELESMIDDKYYVKLLSKKGLGLCNSPSYHENRIKIQNIMKKLNVIKAKKI